MSAKNGNYVQYTVVTQKRFKIGSWSHMDVRLGRKSLTLDDFELSLCSNVHFTDCKFQVFGANCVGISEDMLLYYQQQKCIPQGLLSF